MQLSEGAARAIDRASPIPFYYQLQEILKEEIERGTWQPGDLLPSEAELEQFFGVSRTVIRQALDVLQADGQISRGKGKRSMVAEPKFRWEATIGARTWNQPSVPNQVVLGRVIDARRVPAGGHIGRLLGVHEAAHVFELSYVQEVGGYPVALSQMYLRPEASPKLAQACAGTDTLPLLIEQGPDVADQLASRYGIEVAVSDAIVEQTQLNKFEADLLGVSLGGPAFLLSSLDLDAAEAPLSFTRTVIRGDQFRFSLTLRHREAEGITRSHGLMAYMTGAPGGRQHGISA
jgi:GntR family transcriptional regulator